MQQKQMEFAHSGVHELLFLIHIETCLFLILKWAYTSKNSTRLRMSVDFPSFQFAISNISYYQICTLNKNAWMSDSYVFKDIKCCLLITHFKFYSVKMSLDNQLKWKKNNKHFTSISTHTFIVIYQV